MNDPRPSPPCILLATDLGLRCDRARERAARLAHGASATAVAATVVEPDPRLAQQVATGEPPFWYSPPSPAAHAAGRLRRDLDSTGLAWRMYAEEGNAGDVLLRVLGQEAQAADVLVVTGPVRQNVLGPAMLGSSVDRLLRRPATSLLMVRQRALDDYRHLLVASDFSAPSKAALLAARSLFPRARLTLLHGFDVPMLGLMDSTRDSAVAQTRARAREEAAAFLRDCGLDPDRTETIVEHGDPARLVQLYADTFEPDLAVVGTHGRGAVYDVVIGSVAKRIVGGCDLDVLLVRA